MENLQEDFDSMVAKTPLSDGCDRRDFLKVALGTGFAAAVMPVAAQTVIKTDATGLTVGDVILTVGDQKVPVYRAQPEGKTNLPVVLVVSEIFGVHSMPITVPAMWKRTPKTAGSVASRGSRRMACRRLNKRAVC